MSELLPCPFCGCEATFCRNEECDDEGVPDEYFGGEWVECSSCHACTHITFPLMDSAKPLLAERWNRRAAQPAEAPIVYVQCRQHAGLSYTLRIASTALPYRKVCPICEPQP